MADLTSRQRSYLKSLAHPLKPILQVGKEGLTDAVARGVEDALHTRELLKIKVLESAPADAREIGAALAAAIDGAELVQVIGRTAVIYRAHPEAPEITLPG
jgi:RNA-binding protein